MDGPLKPARPAQSRLVFFVFPVFAILLAAAPALAAEFSINVQPGWQFLSIPTAPAGEDEFRAAASGCTIAKLLNGDMEAVVSAAGLEPGLGYWVWCSDTGTKTLTFTGRSVAPAGGDASVLLQPGWSIIGNPYNEPIDWAEGVMFDDFCPGVSWFYYSYGDFFPRTPPPPGGDMQPGKAYLVKAETACTVTFRNPNQRKWTIIVYMGADNNLREYADADIAKFTSVETGADEIAVTFLLDTASGTTRFEKNDAARESLGFLNSAEPANLTDFISWSVGNFPARSYALMLWDHGDGWYYNDIFAATPDAFSPLKSLPNTPAGAGTRYPDPLGLIGGALTPERIISDDSEGDTMDTTEAADAVAASEVHLDLLIFNACNMGMYEVAYIFKDLADVILASEESLFVEGLPDEDVMRALDANPDMDARQIASSYIYYFYSYFRNQGLFGTLSAVDTSHMTQLRSAVNNLAGALKTNIATERSIISGIEQNLQFMWLWPLHADLRHIATLIAARTSNSTVRASAANVRDLIEQSVVFDHTSISCDSPCEFGSEYTYDNAYGLAVFFPTNYLYDYMSNYYLLPPLDTLVDSYGNLPTESGATSWDDFLKTYLYLQ